MGLFVQKESISMAGAAKETAITLNRGTGQHVREVWITFSDGVAGDYVQLLRKDTASTANERDDSHADSVGVLYAEGYLDNGSLVLEAVSKTVQSVPLLTTSLRVYISSTQVGTAYVNVVYEFN